MPLDNDSRCGSLGINMPLIYLGYSSFSGGKLYVMPVDLHFFQWRLMSMKLLYYFFNYKISRILNDKCHSNKMVVGENAWPFKNNLREV